MSAYYYPKERVAVVAMGGLFPDANDLGFFWNNILSKKVSIKEVDNSVMDGNVFYRPELFGKSNKGDKSYTRMAALTSIKDYTALSKNYKIPPAVAEHMDPNQHTAIYCVDQALKQLKNSLPKERTAVILGTGAPGKNYDNMIRRTFYARVEDALLKQRFPGMNKVDPQFEKIIEQVSSDFRKETLTITEDSAPGMLQNIIPSRIANVFNFWGPAYTVDAACASALGAVASSVAGLLDGSFDAVITGGVEVTISEMPFVAFSGINALSPDGSYPFDSRANGFVMGLGGGILVLKRLNDALRDGDHIISVISGYGHGNDGKGKYIAAPSEEGQARVIQEACEMAGYCADTIELIEAHGTGTIVGDVVETAALKKAFQNLGVEKQDFCGIGSVKSNIGHLRYASGAPGLIKASLALKNKILPPSANIQVINPKLQLQGSPFYILTEEKPWLETTSHPRRANVSAFGFGGSNYHICLEEFRSEFVTKSYPGFKSAEVKTELKAFKDEKGGEEAVFFSGDSFEAIKKSVAGFIASQQEDVQFDKAVFQNNCAVSSNKDWRIAICAHSVGQLKEKWHSVEQLEKQGSLADIHLLEPKGIFLGRGPGTTSDKIAWMFPGQGSQYPNMLKSICEKYPSVHYFYEQIDAIWKAKYGYSVFPLIFGEDQDILEKELKNTKNTHPSLFVSNMALHKLLSESGVKADYMIGHSLGEITALYASGIVDLKTAVHLIGERGFSFEHIPEDKRGQMVSIKADRSKITDIIDTLGLKISVANINAPAQTVVGGEDKEIIRLTEYLSQNNIIFTKLNVSHAFHTGITTPAAEDFYKAISGLKFNEPSTQVMACHLVDFYPNTRKELQAMPSILRNQIVSPVNFVDSVLKLYERGVRVFIETGPSSILTNLVKQILTGEDVKVISSNHKNKDCADAFTHALAELFACGVEVSMVPTKEPLLQAASQTAPPISFADSQQKESIVYSGASVGLPGSFKKVFSDDNFKLLFEGRNLIEMLTDDERNRMLDLNITRLIKSEEASTLKSISSINEVIQLVGKFGRLDMPNDYLVDDKALDQMTETVCVGIAAGYEALKDAGIPLIREYKRTSSGAMLPGRLLLPESMREDTGIIYANGFFPIEFIVQEVSKYVADKFSRKTRTDLIDFYESVISRVSDDSVKKLLSDWFALHYSKLLNPSGETDIYEFNHNFINITFSNANNRLAKYIGAEGPNLYLSAACCSTASAVTIAEDMIRAGRATRMIVIGSDSATTKNTLPWVGGGFLSMGSATDSADLFEAAAAFDNRRKGMILGAGALGLIVEKENDVTQRGMSSVCRILGTHTFNSAGPENKIDTQKYSVELDKFLSKMEKEHAINRFEMASRTVYSSHETYSPKKGGCAETEKSVLENAFGDKFRELKVINTKGMTGHTLHASIEEAVAAKSLQYQQIPPVVNYREEDPNLKGLNLSQGGAYAFDYVLRTIIAFGGNGSYHLLQKTSVGDERIFNKNTYDEWLRRITGSETIKLVNLGRLLVAELNTEASSEITAELEIAEKVYKPLEEAKHNAATLTVDHCDSEVFQIVSQVTKYPVAMLDKDMEMEADLGIDTVKQATILSMLGEKFGICEENLTSISGQKTIAGLIDFIKNCLGELVVDQAAPLTNMTNTLLNTSNRINQPQYDARVQKMSDPSKNIAQQVLELISAITKYPVEMLENEMELEADLGIDTIKQAMVLAALSEKFGMQENKNSDISQYKTIGSIIESVEAMLKDPLQEGNSVVPQTEESVKTVFQGSALSQIPFTEGALCMQVPVFVEEALGLKDYDLKEKKIWVIGDSLSAVKNIASYFNQFSCLIKEFVFEYSDLCVLEERIAAFVNDPVDAIVDCTGLGIACNYDSMPRSEEEKMLFLNSEARFLFYKKLSQINPTPALRIVCALSADGCHGYAMGDKQISNPFYGAVSGFYKGLRKEWEHSSIKIVDLGFSENNELSDEVISRLSDELEASPGAYEIGYAEGKRVVLKLDYVDRAHSKKVELPEMAHFVVTGGGYGITSEIIVGLTQKVRCKLTILGRTKLSPNIHELSLLSEDQLEQKKLAIHDALKKSGEKATPAIVQKEYEKLKNAIRVYKTLSAIKENGSQVCYIDCDIRDFDKVTIALEEAVETNGPVDVMIHAAGIERSKLLSQKTLDEFKEIFYVKAQGLSNLYHALDKKKLKLVIGFSSISGTFGNEAQLDYCAANGFVSTFIDRFKSHNSQVHTLCIAWSGWKDIGMAWRNEFLKTHAEEIGINLIEPERGTAEFIRMLNNVPCAKEVIISKGIRQFIDAKMVKESYNETPLIDWVTKNNSTIEKVFKIFSVKRDPIINHHRLGGIPLVPAVGFMEILAEFHSMIYGKKEHYCFKDIKLFSPLKLFYEKEREIIMLPQQTEGIESFEANFYAYPTTKYGNSELVPLNSMKIDTTLGDYKSLIGLTSSDKAGMMHKTLKEAFSSHKWSFDNSIQLGALFHDQYGMTHSFLKFDEHHIIFRMFMSEEQITNSKYKLQKMLINPAFMDSLFQVCGIHSALLTDRTYLPWEVEEFGVVNTPKESGCYRGYAAVSYVKDDVRIYDVIMENELGEVCYYIKNVSMRLISQ